MYFFLKIDIEKNYLNDEPKEDKKPVQIGDFIFKDNETNEYNLYLLYNKFIIFNLDLIIYDFLKSTDLFTPKRAQNTKNSAESPTKSINSYKHSSHVRRESASESELGRKQKNRFEMEISNFRKFILFSKLVCKF